MSIRNATWPARSDAVGHFAYLPLQKASKSGDQEVAYRAVNLLKQISERVAPELLRLREEDVIHTSEFT